jgi:hypothetical protein
MKHPSGSQSRVSFSSDRAIAVLSFRAGAVIRNLRSVPAVAMHISLDTVRSLVSTCELDAVPVGNLGRRQLGELYSVDGRGSWRCGD